MKKKIECNKKCKHKNKKAFTLVEIIAVIVLIGILSSIAIVSVTGYISKTKKNVLISHENGMKTAGKNMTSTYLSENKYCEDANDKNCPVPKDNSREIVTLEQLIEEGYEHDLKNPYYKEGTDEKERYCYKDISVVQIKNLGNQNYEYKACIICGNEVGVGCSNLYDGLNKYLECRKNKPKDDCKSLLKLKEEDEDETDENYQPGTNKCEKGKVCPKVQCEVEMENDKWTNKDVEVSVRCIDELGGERCRRELYTKKITAKPGNYKLTDKVSVYDRKGRATTCEVKVMQDVRNPHLSLGLKNDKVEITYLKDNESGISTWGLGDSPDNPKYNQLNEIDLKDGINLVYGYAKDNAGNELNRDRGWRENGSHCNGSICRNPYQTTRDRKPPELKPEDIYFGYKIYNSEQKLIVDKSACRLVGYFPGQYESDYDNQSEGCNIKKGLRGTEQWTYKDPIMGIMGANNITDFTDVKLIALELSNLSSSSEYRITVNGETFTRSISKGGRRVLLRFPEVRDLNSLQIQGDISNITNVYVYTRSNEKPVRGKRIFTRNAVQLYLDAKDDISGIKDIETEQAGQKVVSYEKYRSVFNNGTVNIRVVDNSGNYVTQSVTVNNILKVTPVCRIKLKGKNNNVKWWYSSDVSVYFSSFSNVASCDRETGVSARGSSLNSLHDYKCLRPIGNEPYNLSNSYIDVGPNALYPNVDWNKHNSNINNVAAVKDYNVDEFIKLEQDFDHDGEVFKMTKETAIDPYHHLSDANFSAWTKPYGVIYDYAGNLGVCPFDDKSVAPGITTTGHNTMGKYGVLIDKTKPVCTFDLVRDEVRETPDDRDYLNDESSWNFTYDEWMTSKTKFNVLSKEYLSNINEIAITELGSIKKPPYPKFIMQNHDNIWENKNKTGGDHDRLTAKVLRFRDLTLKSKKKYPGGIRTIKLWMRDAAGNVGGCSLTYKIDETPPQLTEESQNTGCMYPHKYWDKEAKERVEEEYPMYKKCSFMDDESGIKNITHVTKPKNGCKPGSRHEFCRNCYTTAWVTCYKAIDNAGNVSYCPQTTNSKCK